MKTRLPTLVDRIGGFVLAVGMMTTFATEMEWWEWAANPMTLAALIYPALLLISAWWSLFLFAVYTFPAVLVAFIWCDSGAGGGPFGIVHFFHGLLLPLIAYGVVRGCWELCVSAQADQARSQRSV